MRRRFTAVLAAALLPLAAVPGLTSGPAEGRDTISDQSLAGYQDVVWDEAAGRLFVSQGPDGVAVFDRDGRRTGLVESAPNSLGLSPDGATVWGYADATATLVRIDAASLQVTTVPVTGIGCATEEDYGVRQILVDSAVWLRQLCSGGIRLYRVSEDGIASAVEPAQTGEPGISDIFDAIGDWILVPRREGTFAFVDARHYRFVTAQVQDTPSGLALVEITSTDVGASNGQGSWALAVTPEGDQAISADGYRYDLASGRLLGAVDARHDARVVAMASSGDTAFLSADTVRLYRKNGTKPWRTFRYRPYEVVDLAISDDRVFEIVRTGSDPALYRLRVLEPKIATDLTAKVGPRRVAYRSPITVTLALEGVGAAPIDILATLDGRQVRVGRTTTDASGHAVARVRLDRSTELTASYPGDATHDPASTKPVAVLVGAKLTAAYRGARSTDGDYAVYRSTDTTRLVVRATPDHTGDCLTLVSEVFAGGRWTGTQYSRCLPLGTGSAVQVVQRGNSGLAGKRIRQKVILERDTDNDTTPSEWTYLRFT